MILDNSWTSAGQKSSLKASLPTGADGEGREAALAAAEGGGEGLPERGDGPGRARHGSPGTRLWLYISVRHTDWGMVLLYRAPHYHNVILPQPRTEYRIIRITGRKLTV